LVCRTTDEEQTWVTRDPEEEKLMARLIALVDQCDEDQDRIAALKRQEGISRKEVEALWGRAWGSVCELGKELVIEQQRITTELRRVEEECKYDDTALVSAIEGLVTTTYKHDEAIKITQQSIRQLEIQAKKAFQPYPPPA